ncbi:MAG: hypothetical protein QM500_09620 [Methylococcales bacterium]
MTEEKKNELIVHSASDLTLNSPEANQHIPTEDANKKRVAISYQLQ